MSCFIEITKDLSELEHYSEIIKISKLSNNILKTEWNIYMMKKKSEFLLMVS